MRTSTAILVALVLAACAHEPRPTVPAASCTSPQGLPQGSLLLFGEMHGSIEAPALIAEVACGLSREREIAVGLEIPSRDQPLIDAFLASRGETADIDALTASDFWQKGWDGRSSMAMLELIEDMRALAQQGHAVDVFAFDDQPGTQLLRDVAIANGIRRYRASHPDRQIIALMGNIHAMQSDMSMASGPVVPSGKRLAELKPVSILVAYPAGTVWACIGTCGVQDLSPASPATRPIGFSNGATLGGYNHTFMLASITASPPATEQRVRGSR